MNELKKQQNEQSSLGMMNGMMKAMRSAFQMKTVVWTVSCDFSRKHRQEIFLISVSDLTEARNKGRINNLLALFS